MDLNAEISGISLCVTLGIVVFVLIREDRRCPACTRWKLVTVKEQNVRTLFGKATFDQKQCSACGFTK